MEITWSDAADGQQIADALVSNRAQVVAAEARELLLVAAFADAHNPDARAQQHDGSGRVLPGTERPKTYGGHGTPRVMEFARADLATLLGTSETSAGLLFRDALDLRHRHPMLWSALTAAAHADDPESDPALAIGHPRVWQARKISQACHAAGLTQDQAHRVDSRTTPRLGHCAWTRFETELQAAIIDVDPAAAQARAEAAAMRRYVASGQCNEHGLKTIIAKLDAGDAIALMAVTDLIAGILETNGDTDPADVRRSKALGILANPAHATALLHHHGFGRASGGGADAHPGKGEKSGRDNGTGEGNDTSLDERVPEGGDSADADADNGTGDTTGGELDLFGGRRIDPHEGTQPAGGAPEDVPGPNRLRPRLNRDFHDRDPDPEHHPATDLEPPTPEHDEPALDPPPDEPPPDVLRPADLHPVHDDSDDEAAQPCPGCGHSSRGSGVDSVLSRPAALVRQLAATGALDTVDWARLRPRSVLYVHLSEDSFTRDGTGVARFQDHGPVTPAQAARFLRHTHVTVKPVIDLARETAADCYEVPQRLREALHLAMPGSVFPFSPTMSRAGSSGDTTGPDADHTTPYLPRAAGGPPGQTGLDNLGFLARSSHRVKTHAAGWIHRQPRQGAHVWRNRYGYWYLVDAAGSHPLGKHPDLAAYDADTGHADDGYGDDPAWEPAWVRALHVTAPGVPA